MGVQSILRCLQSGGIPPAEHSIIKDQKGTVFGIWAGAPTAAAAGYQPGCIAIDETNGNVYRNTGSVTSATWTLFDTSSLTLDQAFDNGKVIDAATSAANAFQVGDGTDDIRIYRNGANDCYIDTESGSNLTLAPAGNLILAPTGAVITITGAATVSSTLGVTGAATMNSTLGVTGNLSVNTNKFTVAAATGNTVIAGSLDVTGTITGPYSITTNTGNPTFALTATTGDGITITGTTLTTGNIIYVTADASLTSGSYFKCYDSSAAGGAGSAVFTVGDLGATTILGSAIGTDALSLTTGDITLSDGNVSITTATAHGGDILDIVRGNSASGGDAIDIDMGSAAVAGDAIDISWSGAGTGDAIVINMTNNVAGGALVATGAGTRTDALIDLTDVPTTSAPTIDLNITTQANDGHVVDIDLAAGSTHSCNVIDFATAAAFTGSVFNALLTNANGATAFKATSGAASTATMISLTSTGGNGGDVITIASTASHAASSAITIAESGTVANPLIEVTYGGASTGDAINITMNGAAAAAQALVISSNVNATSPMISITSVGGNGGNVLEVASTSVHANGGVIQITESGVVANNLIELAYGAASTGDAINITMNSAAVGAQALVIASNVAATSATVSLTTANGAAATLYISNASTDAAGDAISVLQHAAGSNAGLYIAYDALSTGDAIEILMNGAATTSQALTITSNVAATTSMVAVVDTGFVGATGVGLVNISATGALAHANASCLYIAYSGTGAATGLGTSIRVNDTGATATSYAVYVAAATGEALFVDVGKAKFTEAATFKASNRFYLAPNYVTAGGGPNNITATLTDADAANVTLAAGLELFVDMGATTLQAGANNLNLNAGGNVAIKKSTAPTVDKAVISAANSIVHLVYNGTSWVDMSE